MHCIRYVHLILVGIGPGPFQIEIDRAFGSRDIIWLAASEAGVEEGWLDD